ncbi:hypothetical protein PUN28_014712 [Cardiocondyla obscurior]|uniref:Uncharacterized protein n=1 Tax=Cardiocondyla obscurior TaxID=286306 RepID=A0AAW2EYU6_9HYME
MKKKKDSKKRERERRRNFLSWLSRLPRPFRFGMPKVARPYAAIFAAILAIAYAAPGGLTGVAISSGLGPIHAPAIVAAAPVAAAHVIAQPIAPVVHTAPVVTRTYLTHAALPLHG